MQNVYRPLRNFFCGCLAIAVIVAGRVRRAKSKVLDSRLVTAIYFHNPNKRLFCRCTDWLIQNGYVFISDDELVRILHEGAEPPRGAVWLSFDDGFKELLEHVIPTVCRRNIPITVFIPSGIVAGAGLFPWLHRSSEDGSDHASSIELDGMRDSMTAEDVKSIAKLSQVRIGSHTVGHTVTSTLSQDQMLFEFGESKHMLECWTDRSIITFAYPEGRQSGSEGRDLAYCGYQLAVTTEPTFVTQSTNPFFVPRLHVGDNISFPEAICNMVGVWRPAIDPVLSLLRSFRGSHPISSVSRR